MSKTRFVWLRDVTNDADAASAIHQQLAGCVGIAYQLSAILWDEPNMRPKDMEVRLMASPIWDVCNTLILATALAIESGALSEEGFFEHVGRAYGPVAVQDVASAIDRAREALREKAFFTKPEFDHTILKGKA